MKKKSQDSIIITASTFPRWENDSVPTFVYDHAINLKDKFNRVIVMALQN